MEISTHRMKLHCGCDIFKGACQSIHSQIIVLRQQTNHLFVEFSKMNPTLSIEQDKIEAFCRRWKIRELALFGSALRDDFGPQSDIDILVSFEPEAEWGLLEHPQMQDELVEIFGRSIDLVSRRGLERSENWIRKREILESAEILYAAR